jgi:hypothetical protein
MSGDHSGSRDFDRGHSVDNHQSFDHGHGHDFDHHHDHDFDHHHHDHDFFFSPFFTTGFFFNPCYTGYYPYGYDYYYSPGYDYYPYGYDYGAAPNNYYNTYNYYYTNPIDSMADNSTAPAAAATPAENYFTEGVKMFSNANYSAAAEKFGAAKNLVPQDRVLPFAYAQAVFASGDYISAAAAVRDAVAKINPENDGIFYPRRMYPNDAALQQQIRTLEEKVQLNKSNSSLQLLLGYNELGINNLDKAEVALSIASADPTNGPTAEALLKLVNKLRTNNAETPNTQQAPGSQPAVPETPIQEKPAY